MQNNNYYASRVSRYISQAAASLEAQRYHDCIRLAEQAERFDKSNPDSYCLRALSHLSLGAAQESLRIADEAQRRFRGNVAVEVLAGKILMDLGRYDESKQILESALAKDAGIWTVWQNYSAVLHAMQQYQAAKDAAIRALELQPGNADLLSNYANTLKETGAVPEALVALRKAREMAPRSETIRFNLLFTMLFDEATTPLDLRREAEGCASLLAPRGAAILPFEKPNDDGRIRLGLMSNDLYSHACAYFVLPFLANLDHTRIEVFVYSLNGRQDNITRKIQNYAEHFISLAGEPREKIADVIRAAKLDVLIDLGGYTRNTPLRHMAQRLAARQMTWIGYAGTTGMLQIDYRLTDSEMDPAGNEAYHTESLVRAPVVSAVYYPLVGRPIHAYGSLYKVRATPALENGYITFGCCINLAKISPRTLRMWSEVLARCPGSKLLVECMGLDNEAVRAPLLNRMEEAGIASDRVICVNRQTLQQYLTYNRIDVVLDTSPLTGGANACDALWMGVPLVTLAGKASHERVAASFLRAVGLEGLVCRTEAQYVEMAVELAEDVAQLNALRQSIRPMFEASPLSDAAGFCRWFEGELAGWVGTYRQPGLLPRAAGEGVYFGGRWHAMEEIVLAVVRELRASNPDGLINILENISAKWSRHWLVAYALSEIAYRDGDREAALDLLIDSATLRKYSLPLYRLLLARLDELGQDKSPLAAFLQEAFGVELAYLEAQPVPSAYEIAGIPVGQEEMAA
ncbi:O-linked N-acetylglucosamine transferase, SPINDLY family protein [Cupriavidus sp. IDO]|uniref:O-linked N-acetylglucosamine transferase, SPINDLY family protein n=1 Tax=Cupriavidus sp. IDO TaxID=1539142 RepID=UPI000579828D|nr:tetratricopeptide repeat protein [Cupriavidus sp. IDO]KWR79438.1 hypothetical protein RM96_29980 [Cupriavidus sp. IDO]